jgi:phosphoglycerol transferase MdoB-like AlkP superfamily enzyme
VSWTVLIAAIIPVVDAISVWRGPTHHIVKHNENVFDALSFAFPVPGHYPGGGGAFHLGLPDLLFFALFLGAADRWRLRVAWTWLGMTASFGLTLALANHYDVAGLPALPLLAAGYLLPNADLLWTRLRRPVRA